MERQIDLNEISDGRLYGLSDMVRADCGGCAGCSACCSGMGRSVVLDPLDMHRLAEGTGVGAETLLTENLELNVVDGIVLPNLKMKMCIRDRSRRHHDAHVDLPVHHSCGPCPGGLWDLLAHQNAGASQWAQRVRVYLPAPFLDAGSRYDGCLL